jgi:hypothetical protein
VTPAPDRLPARTARMDANSFHASYESVSDPPAKNGAAGGALQQRAACALRNTKDTFAKHALQGFVVNVVLGPCVDWTALLGGRPLS